MTNLQKHLRILSGQYGLLRPLDLMQAYRLEMGSELSVGSAKNLYDFWTDKITNALASELAPDEPLVNLASNEYFKVINTKKLLLYLRIGRGILLRRLFFIPNRREGRWCVISFRTISNRLMI